MSRERAAALLALAHALVKNDPEPEICKSCGSPLAESTGYVGEQIVYCPDPDCPEGILWEDQEDAINRVI